jgi:hypothetical protein
MRRMPMPSPLGTNKAGLYLRRSFARGPVAAYDEDPERARMRRKERARAFFEGLYEDFCRAMGLEDDTDEATDESNCEAQHNAISAAASEIEPATDKLPTYGGNGMPKNWIDAKRGAMDAQLRQQLAHIKVERDPPRRQPSRPSEQVRQRAERIAPGLASIKLGV